MSSRPTLRVAPSTEAASEEASSFARVLRGAGVLYASTIFVFVGRLGFAILVARMAGAEGLGIFTLGFVSLQILSMLALFGIEVGLMHYATPAYQKSDGQTLRNLLWASILPTQCLAFILSAAFWLLMPSLPFAETRSAVSAQVLQLFALALPPQVLIGVLGAFAIAQGNIWVRVLAERIVPAFSQIALVLVLINFGNAVSAATLAFVASVALGAAVAALICVRLYPRGKHIGGLWRYTRQLYAYSYMQGLARVVGYALMNANLFLLGALADSTQVGIYAAASRLTMIGTMFLEAFGQMFAPMAASHSDAARFKSEFQWLTKWLVMVSAPLLMVLAIFAPLWMSLLGPAFAASSSVLTLLAAAQMLSMMTGAAAVSLAVRGYPRLGFINNLLGWGTSAVLTAMWAGTYGALGAATAYFCAIVVFEILEVTECVFYFRFFPFGKEMLNPLLALGALGLSAWFLGNALSLNIYSGILVVGLLLLGYVIFLWRFGLKAQDFAALHALTVNLRTRSQER